MANRLAPLTIGNIGYWQHLHTSTLGAMLHARRAADIHCGGALVHFAVKAADREDAADEREEYPDEEGPDEGPDVKRVV